LCPATAQQDAGEASDAAQRFEREAHCNLTAGANSKDRRGITIAASAISQDHEQREGEALQAAVLKRSVAGLDDHRSTLSVHHDVSQ